jgi:hypothetical protein
MSCFGIDLSKATSDPQRMTQSFTIDARFDADAQVWLATSADVPGLVVEADSRPGMIEEVRLVRG